MHNSSPKTIATRSDVSSFHAACPTECQTPEVGQPATAQQLSMKVANRPSERRQAFQLCHEVYCRSGLTDNAQ